MYNVNEIKARLANGETMDSIAAELTQILNDAQREHDAEIAAAAEAKKAAAIATQKRNDMAALLDTVIDFMQTYYPDLCADVTKDLSANDKTELYNLCLDAILEALDKTADAASAPRSPFGLDLFTLMMLADMADKTPAPSKNPIAKVSKTEDDILNDFLGKICH